MYKYTESKSVRYEIELDETNLISYCIKEEKYITRRDGQIIHTNVIRTSIAPEELSMDIVGVKYPEPVEPVVEPKFEQI